MYTATDDSLKNWSGPTVMSGISNAGLGYIDTFPVYYKCDDSIMLTHGIATLGLLD